MVYVNDIKLYSYFFLQASDPKIFLIMNQIRKTVYIN